MTPSTDPSDLRRHATGEPWRVAASRAAHPSIDRGGDSLVATIAEGLAAVAVPWELATGTTPSERCYELLLSTDLYDAWLIHWPAGSGLDAHDHGGSTGAFAVVSGVLDEDRVGHGVVRVTRIAAGESVTFGGDHVHAVQNRGDVAVTSVHVYSPPLRAMSFYGVDDNGRLVADRVDEIDVAP